MSRLFITNNHIIILSSCDDYKYWQILPLMSSIHTRYGQFIAQNYLRSVKSTIKLNEGIPWKSPLIFWLVSITDLSIQRIEFLFEPKSMLQSPLPGIAWVKWIHPGPQPAPAKTRNRNTEGRGETRDKGAGTFVIIREAFKNIFFCIFGKTEIDKVSFYDLFSLNQWVLYSLESDPKSSIDFSISSFHIFQLGSF